MKIKKVTSSRSSELFIDSFSYGKKLETVTVGDDSLYEICYVVGGAANIVNPDGTVGRGIGNAIYRGDFADKKPSSAVFNGNVLTLSRGMNLLFFTAPERGYYKLELDCMMLKFGVNCNIWYFKGSDADGYRFVEIDGNLNRHDPCQQVRQVFPFSTLLERGESIVLGIGNYYGAVMQIFNLTVKNDWDGRKTVYTFPSPQFALYDHPHSGNTTHLEKTSDGILSSPSEKVILKAGNEKQINVFSIKLGGRYAKKIVEKNFPTAKDNVFSYGYSHSLLELAPLLFLNEETLLSETMSKLVFDEIIAFGDSTRSVKISEYVEKAKASMLSALRSPVRITDVSAQLGISDRYLYNLFIKYEGISPKQFLNNARLEMAKRLLSESDSTITEIAEECGFTDVLCFSHFFSDHAGISPSAFKRMKRDNGEG